MMLGSTRVVRVFAYRAAIDCRKGFDGLFGLVRTQMGHDPMSGDCYLFTNARRTTARVLFWDGTGLCMLSKRLEGSRFGCLWRTDKDGVLKLTMTELALFLEGCRDVGVKQLSPDEYRVKALAG